MIKVELREKFNTSVGQVLVVKSDKIIKIGDIIEAEGQQYTIEHFITPSGAFDEALISVKVK